MQCTYEHLNPRGYDMELSKMQKNNKMKCQRSKIPQNKTNKKPWTYHTGLPFSQEAYQQLCFYREDVFHVYEAVLIKVKKQIYLHYIYVQYEWL